MAQLPTERNQGMRVAHRSARAVQIGVRGIVQGVGFRPFVYQLAAKRKLTGWVFNTSEDVKIWIEGNSGSVSRFLRDLHRQAPPRSVIEDMSVIDHEPAGYDDFRIRDSVAEEGRYQLISPDIATCQHCLMEVFSPKDRRYRYPFTNCTNCGPRFTIIEDIPYDRPLTTMGVFTMCPECKKEYDDPHDRRFHAQPNACPQCGPTLGLLDNRGKSQDVDDAIIAAAEFLREGKIVAIKGLGGFLLACDATNSAAVEELRRRKDRPAKPFAVMVATVEDALRLCLMTREERRLLESPQVHCCHNRLPRKKFSSWTTLLAITTCRY